MLHHRSSESACTISCFCGCDGECERIEKWCNCKIGSQLTIETVNIYHHNIAGRKRSLLRAFRSRPTPSVIKVLNLPCSEWGATHSRSNTLQFAASEKKKLFSAPHESEILILPAAYIVELKNGN